MSIEVGGHGKRRRYCKGLCAVGCLLCVTVSPLFRNRATVIPMERDSSRGVFAGDKKPLVLGLD